jgi:hypothetical protein
VGSVGCSDLRALSYARMFDRAAIVREDAAMLRIVAVLFIALGCSKAKDKEAAPPPPPPPPAADAAMAADAGEASDAGAALPGDGGAADGSAAGSAAAGSADGSGAGTAVAASDFNFDKLSKEDQIKFMKQKVMPHMKPLLQKFDPKEFKNVTCKTCHGKDPQGTKYKMPSKDLPALDFDAIKAGKEDPKMVEFMSKVVKPEMAKLLNEPEMTESNPKGFGCLDCHQMKKK